MPRGKRRPAAWWDSVVSAYVQGTEKDGTTTYPSMADLAAKFSVAVKTIEKRSKAEGWPAQRKARIAAAGPLKRQQALEAHLKETLSSNRTYGVLARALRNKITTMLNESAASETPMSVADVTAWTRALGEAQRIEMTAAGETPAILTGQEQTETLIAEIEAQMAKASGSQAMTEEQELEALASLEGLPVYRLLRIWGLAAPLVPKNKGS